MLASGISRGSGAGWPGVLCRGPTWLTAQPQIASDMRFVIPVRSLALWFYFRPPLPPALESIWWVLVFPLTCQCDGAMWVAAAHRVGMETLRVRVGLIGGLTLLSRHHSPSLSIVDEFNVIGVYIINTVTKLMSSFCLALVCQPFIQQKKNEENWTGFGQIHRNISEASQRQVWFSKPPARKVDPI